VAQTLQIPDLIPIDQQSFGSLVEPYRRELHVHCYRMIGSTLEAEDLVQDTFLRAWRHRNTFEGRASLRAWLYKIATNVCLDSLEKRPRRMLPITRQGASNVDEPIPADVNEPIWLEPFPDDRLTDPGGNPEAFFARREMISVAFIAALHLLTPRQRAVLILRDVLDWQASEVADLLDLSVSAVKSALHRARKALTDSTVSDDPIDGALSSLDEPTQAQLARYVLAWETADIHGLMALLKEDATFSMPPIPSWYQGRETIGKLASRTIFGGQAQGRWKLLPTHANRQTAFGLYQHAANDQYAAYGIQVVTVAASQIADITTFRNPTLVAYFNLPATLPG
jgi:RNA polymerase sigma-70 factor (ECF subfamily)